ncbi:MAG: hypothetical protein ABSA91_02760 [Acidimicrobiales bacterium]|jgi:hypothetical protein
MVRSYSLVDGYIDAFDNWNPVVAAPLVRMQLDNLVRLSYLATAPSATDVARHLVLGGEFQRLKDPQGKFLTDAQLVRHAQDAHPWVSAVYEATSGWVHFSPSHIWAAVRIARDGDGPPSDTLQIMVPLQSERIPLSALQSCLAP